MTETTVKPRKRKLSPKAKKAIILSVLALGLLLVFRQIRSTAATPNDSNQSKQQANADKVEVAGPTATAEVNQGFSFPLLDNYGTEVSQVQYHIDNAELRNEVIIKGQKATSIAGRQFLVINLKITNDYDQGIEINSRDYVRLQISGSEEWLAPTIHNDPVDVQAISTKPSRLGFTIDEGAQNLVLQVGEISGEKQQIPLTFN